jgi:hypothetical protein
MAVIFVVLISSVQGFCCFGTAQYPVQPLHAHGTSNDQMSYLQETAHSTQPMDDQAPRHSDSSALT